MSTTQRVSKRHYLVAALLLLVLAIWGEWPVIAQMYIEDRCQVPCTQAGYPLATGYGDWPYTLRNLPANAGAAVAAFDPDQIEAAADILAADDRRSIVCCVTGTTQVLVREAAATGGTVGMRYNGGTVANDGTGMCFKITAKSSVYFYDVAGAGNADLMCTTETY